MTPTAADDWFDAAVTYDAVAQDCADAFDGVPGGVTTAGMDISAGMVAQARRRHPGLTFEQGDLRRLPYPDGAFAAVACLYSVIHLQRHEVPAALAGIRRVLRPGGVLLLAVHGGGGEHHQAIWFGKPVRFDGTFFGPDELRQLATGAGFAVEELLSRPPYPAEHQTERLYLWAVNPA